MLDVTECHKIQDENRGVNEKLWIDVNGRAALFKKTQVRENGIHTNAHFSEAVVSDICRQIGISCAEIEIAKRGNDIGCISYSFLHKGEELIDLTALIQNIRPSFNSKEMIVADTYEKYSIPLILEALEAECNSQEEFNALKKDFLRSCIVDSLIEHYDRNASNISIIRNENGIRLAPMYDNGTSLGVSIPTDVARENIRREEWIQEIRERSKSKIGVEGERHSNYDRLLEYILSNYYGDVKDLLDVIKTHLTPESIQQILANEQYRDLDDIHKMIIFKILSINRENLLEQCKKYELKFKIEELLSHGNESELLASMANGGLLQQALPEVEQCIDCPQRSPYHGYDATESVDKYMARCIGNINNLEEMSNETGIKVKLSDKDKRLVQWAIMFNEMGKPASREEIVEENGAIRDTFRNYSKIGQDIASRKMKELKFYQTEIETIQRLIASHDRRNLDSDSAIKRFLDEIGEKNLDLYFAMKLAEINAKYPETSVETIDRLKRLKQRIGEIQNTDNRDIIRSLPQNGKKYKH